MEENWKDLLAGSIRDVKGVQDALGLSDSVAAQLESIVEKYPLCVNPYYAGCTHIRKLLTKINQIRLKSEKAEAYVNTGVLMMNLPVLRETVNMQEISEYVHEHRVSDAVERSAEGRSPSNPW